ncbi:uncharacterized protein LOC131003573 [Salvia miltiorrhiza]|uniref:uncharacterized protein LOC131003573 n=1 Tax=Salvia miltiorrhiza TaxID=226208 RepID=UPI0025AD9049|nr:uncharacterized protein LOC131003573 [Salvia miltiorrhiza]XP_057786084.1 uncharacterized protein LOC131003573 [Salvia miltiorrhiza]XP_057786085.1 uncharacterized protein LOC131003573 [Salvia miltiorrhiza]
MADGSVSRGQSRSRPVLGDVTNRNGKRGFSGKEKDGGRSLDFNDKDTVKRICASPRPCSEINSLKGNVISGLSKIPVENREPNLYDGSERVHSLKGKNDVIGNLKFNAGSYKHKILDLRGANTVTVSINELEVVDNDSSDGCGKSELSKNSLPRVDEVAGQNRVDPNLANLGGEGLNSVAKEADGYSPLDSLKENKISGAAEVANENRCSSLDFGMHDAIQSVNTEGNNELGESSHADTSRTVSETGTDFLHDGEENISPEGTQSDINDHHNHLDDHNADNFILSQSGSIDCTVLPQSQESRVFGIDKSNELKEDECALMTVGSNAIDACSCSFCTKAQDLWLDLHQKDIKARLSALKKSQKDASILAERSYRIKVNEKHGAESVTRASKMESHLTNQWRSLFQHMSDIWEAESNQLEASLLPLNNLKDKCKAEMELIRAKLSEKH